MANHDELVALFMKLGHFHMDLGHQGASGIKDSEAAGFSFCLNGFAHTVCTEHQSGAWRYIAQFFYEDGTLGFKVIHHIGVVHNFVAHIDRPTKFGNGRFHNVDRTINACAETARFSQQNFLYAHKLPFKVDFFKLPLFTKKGFTKYQSHALQTSQGGLPADD